VVHVRNGSAVSVIIPALDEEEAVQSVIRRVPAWADEIIVVDNGSRDGTGRVAAAAGARVVDEPRHGYGRACMAGARAARSADVLVFLDADGSDHPEQMERLADPIVEGRADLVIGSRTLGSRERGAMSLPQRFGNFLAPLLIRLLWRGRFTDLGPFRAIRADSLQDLRMDAPTYGWTVQMQIRALRARIRCLEVAVDCARRKAGRSKISGTVRGVVGAGAGILACVAIEALSPGFDRTTEQPADQGRRAFLPGRRR